MTGRTLFGMKKQKRKCKIPSGDNDTVENITPIKN